MSLSAVNELVREALLQTGDPGPDPAMVTRARKRWLHQIIQDVQGRATIRSRGFLKSLHVQTVAIAETYRSRYALPEDFDQELDVFILDGGHTGSAQSGDATTVVLASDEDISASDAQGRYILMTSGTSKGQYRQIIAYDAGTVTVTIDTTWDNRKTPASGDGYMIVAGTEMYRLQREAPERLDRITRAGRPTAYAEFEEHVILDTVPDKAYGILMYYYSDGISVDFADDTWLRLLRRWKNVLTLGIQVRALRERDDAQSEAYRDDYEREIISLLTRERDGGEERSRIGVKQ